MTGQIGDRIAMPVNPYAQVDQKTPGVLFYNTKTREASFVKLEFTTACFGAIFSKIFDSDYICRNAEYRFAIDLENRLMSLDDELKNENREHHHGQVSSQCMKTAEAIHDLITDIDHRTEGKVHSVVGSADRLLQDIKQREVVYSEQYLNRGLLGVRAYLEQVASEDAGIPRISSDELMTVFSKGLTELLEKSKNIAEKDINALAEDIKSAVVIIQLLGPRYSDRKDRKFALRSLEPLGVIDLKTAWGLIQPLHEQVTKILVEREPSLTFHIGKSPKPDYNSHVSPLMTNLSSAESLMEVIGGSYKKEKKKLLRDSPLEHLVSAWHATQQLFYFLDLRHNSDKYQENYRLIKQKELSDEIERARKKIPEINTRSTMLTLDECTEFTRKVAGGISDPFILLNLKPNYTQEDLDNAKNLFDEAINAGIKGDVKWVLLDVLKKAYDVLDKK